MINPVNYVNVPTFGSAATKVQPDAPTYVNGFIPEDVFPSEWMNWFLAGLTGNGQDGQSALNDVIAELDNLVTDAGGSVSPGDTHQVAGAVQDLIDQTEDPLVLSAGSSYALGAGEARNVFVGSTADPFTVTLPPATGSGYRVRVVNISTAASGLVLVVPQAGEFIGHVGASAGLSLQNVDQGGNQFFFRSVELVDALSGTWSAVSGQWMPRQAVDADGDQYYLGGMVHVPLKNTVSRALYASAPPALNAWSAAISAWGIGGVPVGAKAVRVKVRLTAWTVSANMSALDVLFSDNSSNVPNELTGHPGCLAFGFSPLFNGVGLKAETEIDVPLNASGQFYLYTSDARNVLIGSCFVQVAVVGYCMGL